MGEMASRRSYGSGRIFIKHGSYYGRWWPAGGGYTNRKLGPVRKPGSSEGLTKRQAERRLRELMGAIEATSRPSRTITIAGTLFTEHLQAKGRSRSHLETVESHLRVHLVPFFGDRPVDRIDETHVTALVSHLRASGRAPKTIRNVLSTLHSVLDHSLRLRWITLNPCRLIDGPDLPSTAEVRYLDAGELEMLLRDGIPDDEWGRLECPLYLLAAMTGLRQGELLGLRWRDIDWLAHKVRVRQSYVRGEFKPPKSKRGSRAVPLARRVAAELERHFQSTPFQSDEDLVFAHPHTGGPLDRSKVRKRFQRACARAGLRTVRFHDLRHTFGTRVAASGDVSLRTLQEWLGHRDPKTTLIYADYQPGERESEIVERAFNASRTRAT